MDNMDTPCILLINQIMQGQRNIRFNMETEISALLADARETWMLEPRPSSTYIADDWTGKVVICPRTRPGKQPGTRVQIKGPGVTQMNDLVRMVTHHEGGYTVFLQQAAKELQFNPEDAFAAMGIAKEEWPDIYSLEVSLPAVKCHDHNFPEQKRQAWLYDPQKHFWPK